MAWVDAGGGDRAALAGFMEDALAAAAAKISAAQQLKFEKVTAARRDGVWRLGTGAKGLGTLGWMGGWMHGLDGSDGGCGGTADDAGGGITGGAPCAAALAAAAPVARVRRGRVRD